MSDFISDRRRISYQHAAYTRMYRGQSVLIEGNYGAGKTSFLQMIEPKKLKKINVESLDNIHCMLVRILRQMDFDVRVNYQNTSAYLEKVCELKGKVAVFIDEAGDMDKRIWPYLKRIMDAGIPVIMTGLPKVRTWLTENHPDILSRMKVLVMYPVEVDEFIKQMGDFESEGVEQMYSGSGGDIRKFLEFAEDLRDKEKQEKTGRITLENVLEYLDAVRRN